MIATGTVNIDVNKIPRYAIVNLARTICNAAEEYFKDPAHEEAFQKWLQEYREKKSGT